MDYANILRPLSAQNAEAAKEPQKTIVSLDTLDSLVVADKTVKELPFVVTCGIVKGVPLFFAQLKGNKRFSCAPIMPKDEMGAVLAPPNGSEGYLTLELSENAQLTLASDGKYEFSVRPTFKSWETVADRAARIKAQKKS